MGSALDSVLAGFGASLTLALVRTLPSLVRFYASWSRSGLAMTAHRGYGQSACKAFGVVPAPKLSVNAMASSGVALILLVLFSCVLPAFAPVPSCWRSISLAFALVAYHLYFTQLYCEAHVGAHVTVLIPPALLLLSLSPALGDETASPALAASLAAFTCWMMKIVITSAYCGAGVCKIAKSISSVRAGGISWVGGSTLQAFMFEAMFLSNPSTHTSFGVPTPFSHALQRLHVCLPQPALAVLSAGPVAFEALAPLMLLAPAHLASCPFAIAGLAFHYGIAVLQNIDFVSWWGPAYAFLLADPAAWAGGGLFACPADAASLTLSGSIAAAFEVTPMRAAVCLAYVGLHVLAVVLLRFYPDVEILPFSSFPMFGQPTNLFDGRVRKWFWLSDKPHASGTLKNYAFPMARPQTVLPSEICQLPFKYLLYGHGGITQQHQAQAVGAAAPPALFTNVEMTPALKEALAVVKALGDQRQDTFAKDATAMPKLLEALDRAKRAFADATKLSEPLSEVGVVPSTADVLTSSTTKADAEPNAKLDAKLTPGDRSPPTAPTGAKAPSPPLQPSLDDLPLKRASSSPTLAADAAINATIPWLSSMLEGARLSSIRAAVWVIIGAVRALDCLLVSVRATRRLSISALTACVPLASSESTAAGADTATSSPASATPTQRRRPSVVIVGGSFAGLRAKRDLADLADVVDITVVDSKDYFEYTPGVLRLFVRPELLPRLTTPLSLPSSKLVVGQLEAVGPNEVSVRSLDGVQPTTLPYDYLLLACGTQYPCAPIRPSPAEPSLTERQRVWDRAAARLRAASSVIVIGGGLVGVELVAEVAAAFPSTVAGAKSITLLSSGAQLCSSMPKAVGASVLAWLQKRNVNVRLHSPVAQVDASKGEVHLTNGSSLNADVVYDCRGNGAPTTSAVKFAEPLAHGLDAKGRVLVDASLRCVAGNGRIYAMGDVMVAPDAFASDLKLGHTAELNADVAAHNVKALLKAATNVETNATAKGAVAAKASASLVTYPEAAVGASTTPRVCCVSLGESDGVLVFNELVLSGMLAAIAKPVLEWTKIAACAERPGAVLFWRFGDFAANLLSRTVLYSAPPSSEPPAIPTPRGKPLILFDGVCLLCATFVHFVLDHDQHSAFDFAPLQGATGTKLLTQAGLPLDVSTMVLVDEAGVHVRSTAALRVIARCGLPYSWLRILLWLLPAPLRDAGYKMVASVRYLVFGKDDGTTCRRMTKAIRQRFHE